LFVCFDDSVKGDVEINKIIPY